MPRDSNGPVTAPGLLDSLSLAANALAVSAAALYDAKVSADEITFELPRRAEFGDRATNLAFSLAKKARRSPQQIATELINDSIIREPRLTEQFSELKADGGFINLRLAPALWQNELADIVRAGKRYGELPGNGRRVSLEFGSANPTGPLVVVQGRALSIGDALANAMRFCGYDVFTEWISNDAGAQIERLGRSLYARYRQIDDPAFPFPDDGYPGEYLLPIARSMYDRDGARWANASESEWLPHFENCGRDEIVRDQRRTVARFGVRYDLWQSEKELHDTGRIVEGIERVRDRGLTYEHDGALFFRTTDFGDDKDRVVLRGDGRPTYYALDVTYHFQKLQRAGRVVDILGPDHHGYVSRLQALAAGLGFPGKLDVLITGSDRTDARQRAGQHEQTRREPRDARRHSRRSRQRRGPLLLRDARARIAPDLRFSAGGRAQRRESSLLRAIRPRAHCVGAAQRG